MDACVVDVVVVVVEGKRASRQVSVPVSPQTRRADRWSWDLDEEQKRQERWQQEQERLLQVPVHDEVVRQSMAHEATCSTARIHSPVLVLFVQGSHCQKLATFLVVWSPYTISPPLG